jgi:hypothetical protein
MIPSASVRQHSAAGAGGEASTEAAALIAAPLFQTVS